MVPKKIKVNKKYGRAGGAGFSGVKFSRVDFGSVSVRWCFHFAFFGPTFFYGESSTCRIQDPSLPQPSLRASVFGGSFVYFVLAHFRNNKAKLWALCVLPMLVPDYILIPSLCPFCLHLSLSLSFAALSPSTTALQAGHKKRITASKTKGKLTEPYRAPPRPARSSNYESRWYMVEAPRKAEGEQQQQSLLAPFCDIYASPFFLFSAIFVYWFFPHQMCFLFFRGGWTLVTENPGRAWNARREYGIGQIPGKNEFSWVIKFTRYWISQQWSFRSLNGFTKYKKDKHGLLVTTQRLYFLQVRVFRCNKIEFLNWLAN